MAKKYLAIVDGKTIAQRRTDRTYTHVLIGRRDYDQALAGADRISKSDLDDFSYFSRVVAAGVGGYYDAEARWPVDQQQLDRCLKAKGDYTSAEAYAEAKRQQRLADIAKRKAAGYYDELLALTWCGRPDLAAAQLGRWPYHKDVRIIETTAA